MERLHHVHLGVVVGIGLPAAAQVPVQAGAQDRPIAAQAGAGDGEVRSADRRELGVQPGASSTGTRAATAPERPA